MGFGGGQSGAGTTYTNQQGNMSQTTNMGPWGPQQGPLNNLFGTANNLLFPNGSGGTPNFIQPYQGSVTAPVNPMLQSSWNNINALAGQGNGAVGNATGFLNDQLSGKYLSPNSNPYLASMEQAAADPVIRQYQMATAPQTDSAAEMGNRYGSGYQAAMQGNNQYGLGQALQNLSNNFYGQAYQQGVNNMFNAAGMAPSMLQASYIPYQMQNEVGQQQQAYNQQALSGQVGQYMQGQMLPYQTLSMLQGLIGGNYGQQGTTTGWNNSMGSQTTPYYSNPLGSVLGGGLAGLGVAGQLGWQPFGAAAAGGGAGPLAALGAGAVF